MGINVDGGDSAAAAERDERVAVDALAEVGEGVSTASDDTAIVLEVSWLFRPWPLR